MATGRQGSSRRDRERFVTTEWSLVVEAGARGSKRSEDALSRLCSLYWYPVFAFLRKKGYSAEDAQDLTQGFFTRLIEKGDLGAADRSRGRFRTFLLTSCQHYLSNQRERDRAARRGGGRRAISIELLLAESRYEPHLADRETPESLFDKQWCLVLLGAVLDRLGEEYELAGKGPTFDRLRGFLTGEDDGTYEEAAADLGMTTDAVKVAVHRLRRRYREALRQHVADTVASDEEVNDEMRYLLRSMTRSDL